MVGLINRLILSLVCLFFSFGAFAATEGSGGWTCSATQPASLTIDSGSNRKLILIVSEEAASPGPTHTITSVGTEAADESIIYNETAASGDQIHNWNIWNEATIAAMSGSTLSASGDFNNDMWCYATVVDADQADLAAHTDTQYCASCTSDSVTTTSNAGDLVVVSVVMGALYNMTGCGGLTERNDTQSNFAAHGICSGDGGTSPETITGNTTMNHFTNASGVFDNAAAGGVIITRRR